MPGRPVAVDVLIVLQSKPSRKPIHRKPDPIDFYLLFSLYHGYYTNVSRGSCIPELDDTSKGVSEEPSSFGWCRIFMDAIEAQGND